MPYPIRNRLLTDQENVGKSIDELQAVLREVVADILRQQAKEAAQHAMPRLLAGHFTVAEAHFGSERSVMLGRDVAVLSSTLADPAWDYVALGHIHKHQTLNPEGYPPLVYSGSLERINFGEEKEQKGFCWVELTRGSTQWSFIPVAARPFETLQIDVRKEKDPTAAVLAKIKDSPSQDAVYRIQVQLRSEQEPALHDREIEAALPKASSVTIAREVEIDPRVRLGDLAPEALTPLQLIEEYFQSKDMPSQRVEALKDKAEELIRDSD
jgi:exonuclease SbcD